MNTDTFKKLEYIINGYGITQEDLNLLIDLIDENAKQAKIFLQPDVSGNEANPSDADERPICYVCNKKIDDKDFTYDDEKIVVHRQCKKDGEAALFKYCTLCEKETQHRIIEACNVCEKYI